jgi:ribonuclease T1
LFFQGKPVFRTGLTVSEWPAEKVLRGPVRQVLRKWGAAALVASGLAAGASIGLMGPSAAQAKGSDNPAARSPVALGTLPAEAQSTYRLVLSGGPFPYAKDGIVFGNRERQLAAKPRGFYREYTVKTPASRDRGARRIVCGGKPPTQPEACFYTDDHYASFRLIAP